VTFCWSGSVVMKLGQPVRLPAAALPGLAVLLFHVDPASLKTAGSLAVLHSGRCDITATLAVQGINVLTRQAHLMLAGVIPLSPGIRLLAAGSYPVSARSSAPPSRWPDVVD
jgi:hypothetical protein